MWQNPLSLCYWIRKTNNNRWCLCFTTVLVLTNSKNGIMNVHVACRTCSHVVAFKPLVKLWSNCSINLSTVRYKAFGICVSQPVSCTPAYCTVPDGVFGETKTEQMTEWMCVLTVDDRWNYWTYNARHSAHVRMQVIIGHGQMWSVFVGNSPTHAFLMLYHAVCGGVHRTVTVASSIYCLLNRVYSCGNLSSISNRTACQ